jgi:hypothetical protein
MRNTRAKKVQRGGASKRRKLKRACLAAGFATLWGGEAAQALDVKLSITPNRTIMDALVYYHTGVTAPILSSLGTLPANQTTTILDSIVGPFEDEDLLDTSFFNPGYVIVGRYEESGEPGLIVSFPNDAAIVNGLSWDEVFAHPDPFCRICRFHTEVEILAGGFSDLFFRSYADYFDQVAQRRQPNMVTYFNNEATLHSFSDATFGGTVLIEAVPEPGSLLLLVCVLGLLAIEPRRR